mmetsp:Transcript_36621/g.64504  ORF Transcript_36621/g.64504 Transcript_36621/m.64504 type:complete len:243 (+) Transcript_36621:665-1393(+)
MHPSSSSSKKLKTRESSSGPGPEITFSSASPFVTFSFSHVSKNFINVLSSMRPSESALNSSKRPSFVSFFVLWWNFITLTAEVFNFTSSIISFFLAFSRNLDTCVSPVFSNLSILAVRAERIAACDFSQDSISLSTSSSSPNCEICFFEDSAPSLASARSFSASSAFSIINVAVASTSAPIFIAPVTFPAISSAAATTAVVSFSFSSSAARISAIFCSCASLSALRAASFSFSRAIPTETIR